jgi:hypothetical protein
MSREHDGQARGIAFVSTTSAASLLQVVALDGDLCEDRNVKVKRADPPKDSGGGRSGGGGERSKEGDYWKGRGGDGAGGGTGGGTGGVCFDFQKGKCDRGDACRFKHQADRRPEDRDRDRRGERDDGQRRRSSRSRSPKRRRSRSR